MKKRILAVMLCIGLGGCTFAGSPGEGPVIGMSVGSLQSPFLKALVQGTEEEAERQGIRLLVSNADEDLQRQNDQVLNFLEQEVDALLLVPMDMEGLVSSAEEAETRGIPVFCLDTKVNSGTVESWIASDQEEMGRTAARYLAERLQERYGEYRGTVANLMASVVSTSGVERSDGFMRELEQYPEIQVVSTQNADLMPEKALSLTANLLQIHPELDGIWCSGDNNGLGVILAIEQVGMEYPPEDSRHILVISADGAEESLQAVRDGRMDACISQNPIRMGQRAVTVIQSFLNGEEAEAFEPWPVFLVTAENIDSEEFLEYGVWSEEVR